MPSTRARKWKELLDQLGARLADLHDGGGEVLDRAAHVARWDGYPTSSTLGRVGGSSDPDPFAARIARRVDYELGLPGGDGSDPDADRIADAAREMRAHVLEAKRQLDLALACKKKATPTLARHQPGAAQVTECENCARHGVVSIAYKAGRCVACYAYKRRSRERGEGAGLGLDAPGHLVLARPENATRRSLAVRVDPRDPHHGSRV